MTHAFYQSGIAPPHCHVYAAIEVLTEFWMVIPFTLKIIQNLNRVNKCKMQFPSYHAALLISVNGNSFQGAVGQLYQV